LEAEEGDLEGVKEVLEPEVVVVQAEVVLDLGEVVQVLVSLSLRELVRLEEIIPRRLLDYRRGFMDQTLEEVMQ
jgi:hypothetical protein